jgi:uncharacterized membrane protein
MPASATARAKKAKPKRSTGARSGNGRAPGTKAATKARVKPAAAKTGRAAAGKLARKSVKEVATRILLPRVGLLRAAAERAATAGAESLTTIFEHARHRKLPIQRSIDIAVPVRVAWQEWMALEFIPEGVHTVTGVTREGDRLSGRLEGPRHADWSAEVLDEREEQGFAWRSFEESDCAGLVTFHQLSERLTRIELNLDVVPTAMVETFRLTTHLADHRAGTELRRFKARLELINPDLYETQGPQG